MWGPIWVKDSMSNKIADIPTCNYGNIVIPENSRVEFYNAAFLYRNEQGQLKKTWVGSKLDFEIWDYGEHEEMLARWEEPRTIDILMISNSYSGKSMKSGIKYDPSSPHISQRSSREAGKGCGYEAHVEKHPQAYCRYVEDLFSSAMKYTQCLTASQQIACEICGLDSLHQVRYFHWEQNY